ncbi:hypothetical protein M9Y10_020041 [Tritrichomonas musculus]|uniref:Kelch motif family protein n=1 Tax=Tritrichomonas musculus TaxID=1915356 RepID=A0ABR2HF57_9EUKA
MGAGHSGNDHSNYSSQNTLPSQPRQILETSFITSFSVSYSESIPPKSRSSHFTVYFPDHDVAVIGYGISDNNEVFNDIWSINFQTKSWAQFPIDTSSVSPRSGSTAVAVGNKIYVFGGLYNSQYFSDLHIIDLQSKTITHPTLSNPNSQPPGRIGHVMGYADGKIAIWGGFNGSFLKDLWIYEINTSKWVKMPCDAQGRADAAFATCNDNLYIIGASNSDAIFKYNIPNPRNMEVITPTGNPPPYDLKGAMMVAVDRYLVFIGGKLENKRYALIRAFDTVKCWWFVLYVAPDGKTTTMYDGKIDQNGMFMVPRIYNGSIVYRQKKREVVVFLGKPQIDPPSLNVISIGDALSYLSMRSDMLTMLSL